MEKITYDIVFNLKNTLSGILREMSNILLDIQRNIQGMSVLLSVQKMVMKRLWDMMKKGWLKIYLCLACFSSFLRRFSSSFYRSLSAFSSASFSRSCCNSSRALSASSRLFSAEAFIFCSNLLSCGGSFLEVSLLDSIPPILHAPMAPSMRQISII
nr:MAG TPA: hypothetical protein [Caudoviricetes sp.]